MVHASDILIGASFCVDRTEVTQAQYIQFLAAVQSDPAKTDQPPECAFNKKLTNTPDGTCPNFTTASNLPVFCVDWCDAYAYCAFRGKRLCGALGGGTLALDGPVTSDEWHYACTGAFTTIYPYGNSAIVGACHIPKENTPTDPSDDNTKAPVGSYPDCEGGFPGIFDMQGNVAEWTDRCEPGDGSGEEECMTRGGHAYGAAEYWRCSNLVVKGKRNDANKREYGIRCCADAQ
jgi:formylglycine-generating enzyme required for sulfatase activity